MSRSIWTYMLHALISLCLLLYGIYVFLYKKVLISGKLTGNVYHLKYPANVIIATSLLLGAVFVMLVLVKDPIIRKINPFILLLALVLFFIGAFL
jgi:hypothetical protein